ncbi:L domain-like protein [Punctularia strigosozonata HHB-11173 SS5]|uniref:L domain-like protein n=1 Tax=Punctularia strigosozonata (strain HHB-11173) TaxID=741275 RepID=UPI00044184F6|nr:L domain-like protein [Punctularia strigosozonata HHB-11173 SS5]EIN12330.1 L domain-like protein [Punctularia strigosozonata HHB-11173 SS5]
MPKVTFTPSPAGRATSTTPVSALKDPSRSRYQTPQSRLVHHRSVSFSDGKRDGPIVDAEEIDASAELTGEELSNLSVDLGNGDVFVPSARSKRIENLMQGLEEDDTSFEDESPSKDTGRPPLPQLQPLSARRPSTSPSKVASTVSARVNGDVSRRVFSQSHGSPLQKSQVNESKANATFLTECSFAVSHDKLVQVITDVQPFEPYWEELSCIDLSRRNVDSVARLKEFLPKLDSLSLGVPKTVRTLTVASNQLTSLTSFNHLLNLENLDISRNNIDSLRQLACLRHLRELRADGNQITSFDGLQRLDGLVKLSVQNNRISEIDFSEYRWNRLEMLNLSHNRVDHITELSTLSALISLNLDNNLLTELECEEPMPRLRILRVSNNKLQVLGCAPFHNVRTLYADNNDLRKLAKAHKLTKLENLSLRNQAGKGLRVDMHDIRDVKRLYLSGNRMDAGFLTEPCYNLIYLELAACRLTSLVGDMARLVPNLRVLNLNYNFLDDEGIAPLRGLSRLKKLTVIGSRLKGTKALVRCVRGMPEVEMLDFRMNPCTLGWYLPLIDGPAGTRGGGGRGTTHTTGAAVAASAEEGREKLWNSWQELDAKFRRDLPDESYLGRLAYRGLIMRACSQIRMLDGVQVTGKEKDKAERVLVAIMAKTRNGKPPPELGGSS